MSDKIDINTGEVKIGGESDKLCCRALGSCIALVLIDVEKPIGGIAHIMLPGKAPNNSKNINRYAEDAVNSLLAMLSANHSTMKFIACLVGGGNVLKREDDTICKSNFKSIVDILNHFSIPISNYSVGGFERRSLTYYVKEKMVKFTIGSSIEETLYKMENKTWN